MHIYFAIDNQSNGSDEGRFRLWRRSDNEAMAVLLGRYESLEAAKAIVSVDWRPGRRLAAWAREDTDDFVTRSG